MLIARGLGTLLVGLLVTTRAAPLPPEYATSLSRWQPQVHAHDGASSRKSELLGLSGRIQSALRRLLPPWSGSSVALENVSHVEGSASGSILAPRSECSCSSCCTGPSGEPQCCPSTPANGVATVFVTTTVTQTVSVYSTTRTTQFTSTVFETITFIDPLAKTQTDTVTVTSFIQIQRARRADGSPPASLAAGKAPLRPGLSSPRKTSHGDPSYGALPTPPTSLGKDVKRRQADDAAVTTTTTSTLTVDITTTTTLASTVTTTVFNTVFVTVTLAPNAITTVFHTTTIFTTPGTGEGGGVGTAAATTTSTRSESNETRSVTSTTIPSTGASSSPTSSSGSLETMVTSTSTAVSTTSPPPTATSSPAPAPTPTGLTTDQIAGIVLGVLFFLFLLIVLAFLLRRYLQRRARRREKQRPRIPAITRLDGGEGDTPTAMTRVGGGINGDNFSSPLNDGEVRIVIRPAPGRVASSGTVWPEFPRPPSQHGRTYNLFVEDGGSGRRSPTGHGAEWSNTSDLGSDRERLGTPAISSSPISGGIPVTTAGASAAASSVADPPPLLAGDQTSESAVGNGNGTGAAPTTASGSRDGSASGEGDGNGPNGGRGNGRRNGSRDRNGNGWDTWDFDPSSLWIGKAY